jgi:hypothetical protein
VTKGADGIVRPLKPRSFNSLSEAEEENGQSRIYLGIHWAFDKSEGISQGRSIADYVFDHTFMPLHAQTIACGGTAALTTLIGSGWTDSNRSMHQ